MRKHLISAFALLLLLSSCRMFGIERIRGNGNIVKETRQITEIEGIESAGSFNVYLTTSEETSLAVEADENLMPYIETYVSGGKLQIETEDGVTLRPSQEINVYVSAPYFSVIRTTGSGSVQGKNLISSPDRMEISTAGSGRVTLELNAQSVNADIAGSGKITLSGEANSLEGSIAGSGDLHASDLHIREAKIDVAGSGNCSIFAEEKLDVRVAGSGDVRYRGSPSVSSKVAGSGSVSKIE